MVDVTPWFGFDIDLMVVEKGMPRDTGRFVRMTYLEIPVLVRLSTPMARGAQLFMHAGPAPSKEVSCVARGFGSSAQDTIQIAITSSAVFGNVDDADPCDEWRDRDSDFSAVVGGGLRVTRGLYQVTLNLRRTHGSDLLNRNSGARRFHDARAMFVSVVRAVR